ncbi:hypothetical protein HJ588_02205 [Flexivirga sp. ID2601S]|uniref:Diacylglycerol O-acyltransferase n=1 Tax=Flexivirga aerilata TaxID=1656889 RepID=A0A849ADU9_9MICO|nr:hypothetical protein [Flexivirga aerilata]NNG38087.1 hypothetical protein [Flexivirga aerilata]
MSQANRLSPAEEAFVMAEQVLELPIVNQMIWRFDAPLDQDRLERLAIQLARGPLTRRLRRARAPFARASWTAAPAPVPLVRRAAPIDRSDLVGWADRDLDRPFYSDRGVPWVMSVAPFTDGGHAIVITAPHSLSDGSGGYAALAAAAVGQDIGRLPDDGARTPTRWDDVRDAGRQLAAAAFGIGRLARLALRRRKQSPTGPGDRPPAQPPRPDVPAHPAAQPSAYAVADFDEAEWQAAAERRGGSSNSLLIAFSAGLLGSSGRVATGSRIPVSIPVAVRRPGDRRAIATIGATMPMTVDATGYDDLRPLRKAAREALARATDPERDRQDVLRLVTPVLRLLPRKVLRTMALRQPAAVLTCSNVGAVPTEVASLGGDAVGTVTVRMAVQNATVEQLRRARGGLTVWLSASAGKATLSVLAMDPDLWPDRPALQRAISQESAKWSLQPTFW